MTSQAPHHYRVSEGANPIIHAGHYDQQAIEITMVKDAYSTCPTNIPMTIGKLKTVLVEMAAELAPAKEFLNALSPAQYRSDAICRRDHFGIARQAIVLDFDKQPDVNFIHSQLASFFYLMWSTHSHMMPDKGPRYRVYLPLNDPLPLDEWKASYGRKFKCYFEQIGFVDNNAVDPTAYTFGQLAFLPGINAEVGYVELWINDTALTEFFPVGLLPELDVNTPPPTPPIYEAFDWQASTDDIDYLIRCLKKKEKLWSIPACPNQDNHGLNRKTIAVALQSIGVSYAEFCQLDAVMQKHDTHTDSRKAWSDASKTNTTPHPGLLLKLLTPLERKLSGLVR